MALDFEIYGKTIQSKDIRYENVNLLESEDFRNFVDVSQFDTLSADLRTNYFPTSGGRLNGDLIVTGNLNLSGSFNYKLSRLDITTPIINLESNRIYNVDTTINPITGLLPQNPNIGDEIEFLDTRGKWDTNPFYVRSGNLKIEKLNSEELKCDIKYGNFKLNYVDPTNYGWKITTFTNTVTSTPTIVITDPYINLVSLLLHMEGSQGSTTFTDSSTNNRIVTPNGAAQISTVNKRFGNSSGIFNGLNSSLSISNLTLDSGDFTIEAWINPNNVTLGSIFNQGNLDNTGAFILFIQNGSLSFYANNGLRYTGATIIPINQWTNIAACKQGNIYYFFVNGILQGTVSLLSFNHNQTPFKIGDGYGGIRFFNGYIDEVRVTKGLARYTTNYIPAIVEFPNI